MKLNVAIAGAHYRADPDRAISLAIPLHFDGEQPSCFGVAKAQARPFSVGDFVGDVTQGGSCNVMIVELNPHCQGTHTESIHHIVTTRIPPYQYAPVLCPATLVSIAPVLASSSGDSYTPAFNEHDQIISAEALCAALDGVDDEWLQALVIRTLPNAREKMQRIWQCAPFFSREAMLYLSERGVLHLLVDFPSIDRMDDGGHLTAHHLFWGVPEGSHALVAESLREATVSELIYVPDSVRDGHYLLNLQLPAFELDVAPSRPLLIPVEQC